VLESQARQFLDTLFPVSSLPPHCSQQARVMATMVQRSGSYCIHQVEHQATQACPLPMLPWPEEVRAIHWPGSLLVRQHSYGATTHPAKFPTPQMPALLGHSCRLGLCSNRLAVEHQNKVGRVPELPSRWPLQNLAGKRA
jgi:hypothetical protein